MDRTRTCTAWFLLVAFLLGGVVGPTAHRLDHAADRHPVSAVDVVPTHRADLLHAASDAHPAEHLTVAYGNQWACELCATRILLTDSLPISAPPSPGSTAAVVVPLTSLIHAPACACFSSRGPPTRA